MRQLQPWLEENGYDQDPKEFKETVMEVFRIMFPMWTDEELMCHPSEGVKYCRAVCQKVKHKLPENLIMRVLSNQRKH